MKAGATVKVSGIKAIKGVRPFAVEEKQFVIGKRYVLVNRPADKGNMEASFVPLELEGDSYRTCIAYGYMKKLKAGDKVFAVVEDVGDTTVDELGKLAGKCTHIPACTPGSHAADCPRIIVVPVVERIDFSGLEVMNISGFAAFLTDGSAIEGGITRISGRFIRHIAGADTSDDVKDYGLSGYKIIR